MHVAERRGAYGRELTAADAVACGQVLFRDNALVAMPLPESANCCDRCVAVTGTISGNIQSLLDLADAPELPLDAADNLIAQRVPCRRGCGAHYCSEVCENAAFDEGHRLLCGASAFTKFARRTNEAYLFGARVAAISMAFCLGLGLWRGGEKADKRERVRDKRTNGKHTTKVVCFCIVGFVVIVCNHLQT